jgi:hypothetical protein
MRFRLLAQTLSQPNQSVNTPVEKSLLALAVLLASTMRESIATRELRSSLHRL